MKKHVSMVLLIVLGTIMLISPTLLIGGDTPLILITNDDIQNETANNTVDTPHQSADDKNLILRMLNSSSSPIPAATVKLERIEGGGNVGNTGDIRTEITNTTGHVNIWLSEAKWHVLVTITSHTGIVTIIHNSTIDISASLTTVNRYANLRAFKLTLMEDAALGENSHPIYNATVKVVKSTDANNWRIMSSNINGEVIFQEMENGTNYNYTVNYTIGIKNYTIFSDNNVLVRNDYYSTSFEKVCNLTRINMLVADYSYPDLPQNWYIPDAMVILHEQGTFTNITSQFSNIDNGMITWLLPKTTFNFTVYTRSPTYTLEQRVFGWNNVTSFLPSNQLVVTNAIPNIVLNCSTEDGLASFIIVYDNFVYSQIHSNWSTGLAQKNWTEETRNYMSLFFGDQATIKFKYHDNSSNNIPDAFYNWTVLDRFNNPLILNSSSDKTDSNGNFQIVFDTSAFFAQTYSLKVQCGKTGYKTKIYSLSITIMNHTAQISRTFPDPGIPQINKIINDTLSVNVRYASIYPVAVGLEHNNALQWQILESGHTGELVNSGSGDYSLNIELLTTSGFVARSYTLVIFGNVTNAEFAFLYIPFVVDRKTPSLGLILNDTNYAVGPKSLKTLNTDTIYFIVNYTNELLNPFGTYVNTTFTVLLNNNVSLVFDVNPIGGSLFNLSLDASEYYLPLGFHTINITIDTIHYKRVIDIVSLQLIPEWPASFIALSGVVPSTVPKGNNISFYGRYICTEEPRNGRNLINAEINQIIITIQVEGTPVVQRILNSSNLNTIWWWVNNGTGIYTIWINTDVLNLTVENQFTYRTQIKQSDYGSAEIVPYSRIRPINTMLTLFDPDFPNVPLIKSEIKQNNNSVVFRAKYNATETGNMHNGENLINAIVQFGIMNITNNNNTYIGFGIANDLGLGIYNFTVITSFVGEFRVDVNATVQNYSFAYGSFQYGIRLGVIDFTTSIAENIRAGQSSIKLAQSENVSLTITFLNDLSPDLLKIYVDGVELNTTYEDINAYTKKFNFNTSNATIFSIGTHEIILSASKLNYFSKNHSFELEVISQWNTEIETFDITSIVAKGNIVRFNITFTCSESPREGEPIIFAFPANLSIRIKDSLENPLLFEESDIANGYWGYTNVHLVNDTVPWGTFAIWFITDLSYFKANVTTLYQIVITMNSNNTIYADALKLILFNLRPLNTETLVFEMIPSERLTSRQLAENITFTFKANYYVRDNESVSLNNQKIMTEVFIFFSLYNTSGMTLLEQKIMDPVGADFQFSFVNLTRGTYLIVINASKNDHASSIASFTLIVGYDQVEYTLTIAAPFRVSSTLMKVAHGEIGTFRVVFSANQVNEPTINVSVILDNEFYLPITRNQDGSYTFSFIGNSTKIGIHELKIIGSIDGYLAKDTILTLEIIQAWKTILDVIVPPYLYVWNEIGDMILRYRCTESPRVGDNLDGANLLQIKISDEKNTFEIYLTPSNKSGLWGWSNLISDPTYGKGFYRIWINTSMLGIDSIKIFYITPIFESYTYANATVITYIWVLPVELTLTPYLNSNYDIPLIDFLDYLFENNTVAVKINVTDVNCPSLYGKWMTTPTMSYQIWNESTTPFTLVTTGTISVNNAGYYEILIEGNILGTYTLNFTSTLKNYSTTYLGIRFKIETRPFALNLTEGFQGKSVGSPANQNITMKITVKDRITNDTIDDAIVKAIIFGEGIQTVEIPLEKTSEPGVYTLTFSSEFMKMYEQNRIYSMNISVSKANYTDYIEICALEIKFAVDPVLGVPYVYWTLISVTMGVLISIVIIRRRILWAKIPLPLKQIILTEQLIKKKKRASDKRIALTPAEEMFKRYGKEWSLMKLDFKETTGLSIDVKEGMDADFASVADMKGQGNVVDNIDEEEASVTEG